MKEQSLTYTKTTFVLVLQLLTIYIQTVNKNNIGAPKIKYLFSKIAFCTCSGSWLLFLSLFLKVISKTIISLYISTIKRGQTRKETRKE